MYKQDCEKQICAHGNGIRVNGQSGEYSKRRASSTKIGECKQLTAPVTSVELDPHANRPRVMAVGQKTDLARPQRRLQLVLGLQIRVRVTLYYLQPWKPWLKIRTILVYRLTFGSRRFTLRRRRPVSLSFSPSLFHFFHPFRYYCSTYFQLGSLGTYTSLVGDTLQLCSNSLEQHTEESSNESPRTTIRQSFNEFLLLLLGQTLYPCRVFRRATYLESAEGGDDRTATFAKRTGGIGRRVEPRSRRVGSLVLSGAQRRFNAAYVT